ncbi:MAG: radical SAM protein [Nitrospirae bacterium]|nr:radical SAM protein [Nitrospirota bacterium]
MPYANHSRTFADNKYVYPVLSRRSKGISVGINLNPDRVCNFDCIYCQVDRTSYIPPREVDIKLIGSELRETLDLVHSGRLFSIPPFDKTPPELRHLSDIAFSGDGEPTTFLDFYDVVKEVIRVRQDVRAFSGEPRLILLTNTSGLSRPWVQDAIDLLYKHNGEVWIKLDAGSDEYFKVVSRTHIAFRDILHNIIVTAKRHPVTIQSCFNKIDNIIPPHDEITAYCNRLKEIRENGGMIRLVQIYTIARPPAEDCVTPLTKDELTFIAEKVKEITHLPTEVFL